MIKPLTLIPNPNSVNENLTHGDRLKIFLSVQGMNQTQFFTNFTKSRKL